MTYEKTENCWLECVERFALRTPGKTALIAAGEKISYGELYSDIRRLATYLKGLGLGEGNYCLCRSSNTISYVVAYGAVLLLRAVFVPLERSAKAETFRDVFRRLDGCPVVIGDAGDAQEGAAFLGTDAVAEALRGCAEAPFETPPRDIVSHVLFTTGSTGTSKGVVTTNAQFCECVDFAEICGLDGDAVLYDLVPTNHISFLFLLHAMLAVGGTCVISQGLTELGDFFRCLKEEGVDSIHTTPSMINYLLSFAGEHISLMQKQMRAISIAGEKAPVPLQEKLVSLFPKAKTVIYYGSTEAGSLSHYYVSEEGPRANCVGRHNPGVEVLLEREEGVGGGGRLVARTPYCMKGYYGDPVQTQRILRGGLVLTDDYGYEEDGLFFVGGRISDVIVSGGYKIDPTEVEEAALRHPAVAECVCAPVRHAVLGAAAALFVAVKKGETLDAQTLISFLFGCLEDYKVPRTVTFVESVKKNINGKADRKYYTEV